MALQAVVTYHATKVLTTGAGSDSLGLSVGETNPATGSLIQVCDRLEAYSSRRVASTRLERD